MEKLLKKYPNLHVIEHPLVQHKLTFIRDKYTNKKDFKELVDEVGVFLACELTKDFPLTEVEVETPLMKAKSKILAGKKPVLVPILRAGVGMLDGFLKIMPSARIGHIGMARNEETFKPATYYFKLPVDSTERTIILIDPMLATGGSAVAAAGKLKSIGVKKIKFMCLISAPEGIEKMCSAHPDIDVYTASIDEKLDENAYIVPGLGDAGDRLCGTKPNPKIPPMGVNFFDE
ncbi:MAG: uracil phosphoribosyltransferase [Victivallales bacterium]|nr:uracil phosphoribosyltransferase [Victivallales bacterium]